MQLNVALHEANARSLAPEAEPKLGSGRHARAVIRVRGPQALRNKRSDRGGSNACLNQAKRWESEMTTLFHKTNTPTLF